jgi:hypothetical protein
MLLYPSDSEYEFRELQEDPKDYEI